MHISASDSTDREIEDVIQSDTEHAVIGQIDIPVIIASGEVTSPILQDYLENGPIKIVSEHTYHEALEILGKESNIQLYG